MSKRDQKLAGLFGLTRGDPAERGADYLEKLTVSELQWLSQFCSEFHDGSFPKGREALNRGELRRDCRNAHHARRRDIWTQHVRVDMPAEPDDDQSEDD